MSKEWILNSATNRFQLNLKRNVGPVAELIRRCTPKTKEDWEAFYYSNVYPKDHLVTLGKKLYIKISEVVQSEIEGISEEDCIGYIINLVIDRTFDGYKTEIRTVYGQMEQMLGQAIIPAPDEWDRLYNVDFYINLPKGKIALQIKPVTFKNAPDKVKWSAVHANSHHKWEKENNGKVFTIYSTTQGKSKVIENEEVIKEIRAEIERLS